MLLCWLALLLIRFTENETERSWHQIKSLLAPLKVGIHQTTGGEVWQTNRITTEQQQLFTRLQVKSPPRYLTIDSKP